MLLATLSRLWHACYCGQPRPHYFPYLLKTLATTHDPLRMICATRLSKTYSRHSRINILKNIMITYWSSVPSWKPSSPQIGVSGVGSSLTLPLTRQRARHRAHTNRSSLLIFDSHYLELVEALGAN